MTSQNVQHFDFCSFDEAKTAISKFSKENLRPLQKQLSFDFAKFVRTLRTTEGISSFGLLPHSDRQLSEKLGDYSSPCHFWGMDLDDLQ
jgi:hypothetical protein